ncbi:hypothetical protein [Commensalibacter papalotli (ex Botero et al. 2024)]|nr:hypothetical protein [Commensalibacter papalotli (ex Botero et al. 2024)]
MENVDFKYNWGKFYWDAWLNDINLQSCDLAVQGLWINLIAMMHKSDQIGYLVINSRPMTVFDIAKRVGIRKDRAERLLKKLIDNDVCSVTEEGILYCRRIVREEKRRSKNSHLLGGLKKGDNLYKKNKLLSDYRLKSQGEQDVIKDSSLYKKIQVGIQDIHIPTYMGRGDDNIKGIIEKNYNFVGYRLPQKWLPDENCRQYAIRLYLCPDKIAKDFCDYWHAKTGKEANKMDWEAAWRRWCRQLVNQKTQAIIKKTI